MSWTLDSDSDLPTVTALGLKLRLLDRTPEPKKRATEYRDESRVDWKEETVASIPLFEMKNHSHGQGSSLLAVVVAAPKIVS